ncbi:DUF7446 family protein [Pantoea rwandensis]|uniref:Uncharacterized protein n=1 Tax=Pantoea rwandensis TaxID=1076550 RepID=A0A1X1CNU2_9GAMM|nr:hypothetical protein [Pantoea rwandensis]ORM66096.1 hypothetical protein HA51_23940 [Pantoea rwandensis]
MMANPLTIGVSPLTNVIFAGRSKAVKGAAPDSRQFVGNKEDVTGQVLYAAAIHLMNSDDVKVFKLSDGTELHLRADIKEAKS